MEGRGGGREPQAAPASGGGTAVSDPVSFTIGPPPANTSKAFVSAADPAGGNALAPGSIASFYGDNLAPKTAVSEASAQLPFSLGGVSMTIGGAPVPLFFVSPTQFNFQVPLFTLNDQASTA